MLSFAAWVCFFCIGYSYFGYPILLKILPTKRKPKLVPTGPKSFSVIVAARNEEKVIAERLTNILECARPADSSVQFLVCSDASDDRTDDIVRGFPEVKLVRSPERWGKEYAQKLAVAEATGEILLFTDAKVKTEPDILLKLSEHFKDITIGAVSSEDRVLNEDGTDSGEGLYVKYEMWLRQLESNYSTLVGLSGSCFAVRKEVTANMRSDIPSDFSLLIESVKLGLSGITVDDVVCSYKSVGSTEREFSRKVRTILRGITTLAKVDEVMRLGRYRSFAWQIWSHKMFRWLVPFFFILGCFLVAELAPTSLWWSFVGAGLTGFCGLALYGFFFAQSRDNPFIKIPLFFLVTNAAILIAWIKFLRGERAIVWNPSVR